MSRQRGVIKQSHWRRKSLLKRVFHFSVTDVAFPERGHKGKDVISARMKGSRGIPSIKHRDMKLYFPIALGIAFSALFGTTPIKAVDYQGSMIHEIGRSIGWIQAACFFARPSGIKNKISPDMAQITIGIALKQVAMKFGKEQAMKISKDQFKLNTQCQQFWPTEYLRK